ncbi:MAG TPA: MFS transporter [Polyangiaceae bacterium]|nr:MFS transporter [Polyangiaceae bacterium]
MSEPVATELAHEMERPGEHAEGASFFHGFVQRVPDPNIWRIYGVTLALGMAYGTAISVIGRFLTTHGVSKLSIGQLAAWFAAGIVAFSLPMGPLARRFSAKSMLAVSLAGYAAAVALFPFTHDFWALAALRFFDGACSVGVWVSSESILLARSGKENKAFVTSLYAIAVACGYVGGPLLAFACSKFLPLQFAFILAAAIAICTSVYVLLRLAPDVRAEHREEQRAGSSAVGGSALDLLWRIKTSCFGTFAYGYFQASVVLFLPLYLMEKKGISESQTIVIPAYFAAGMLLFSNYAGRLADRYGHLLLMRSLGLVGMTMVLGFVYLDAYPAMCLAVFVAGGSLASISPVSLALQGVVAHPAEYERSTSIYNAFYAAGMLLGPFCSSYLFERRGGEAMLFSLALLWTLFIVFAFFFRRDDPAALRISNARAEL